MNPWSSNQSQMMMVPMMMGDGGYGGFNGHSKGGKGKGGRGTKAGSGGRAKGQGKGNGGMVMQMCQPCGYEDLTWQSPQPAQPCSRCLSKDHFKNRSPRTTSRIDVRTETTFARSVAVTGIPPPLARKIVA